MPSFVFSAWPARWPDISCSRRRSRFAVIGLCVAFAVWTLLASDDSAKIVLQLGGVSWSMEDFVRGWLITGRTGSGKTQCAINAITYQIFQNVPQWGGVCLDQKGLYWEILVRMAAHFGREGDLTLLQTRPVGKDVLWRPVHTINITGNPNVPASTYAKVIVDTAVSLTGGRGQNPFFPTKAQIAIQTGFEVLRHMEAYVTIPNIHRLLLHEEDANAAIETLMNRGDQRSHELVVALRDGFFGQPPEQLGAVQGTLSTYLEFFTDPEIAEVFCANEPTFSMDQIDAGKIVCIAMPQKFQAERLYINTILKLSYYFHALSRFDKPAERTRECESYRPFRRRRAGDHHGRGIGVRRSSRGGDHSRGARDHRSRDPGLHVASRLARQTLRGCPHAQPEQRTHLHRRQSRFRRDRIEEHRREGDRRKDLGMGGGKALLQLSARDQALLSRRSSCGSCRSSRPSSAIAKSRFANG